MLPIYEVLLQIWFYATPIIYPMEIIPAESQWLFRLNPMYYLIEVFRYPLMNGAVPGMEIWLPALGVSITSLVLGAVIFTARSREYAYRI
jgi:ABC-type polysaccharide/polyol phosphate export permease